MTTSRTPMISFVDVTAHNIQRLLDALWRHVGELRYGSSHS